MVTVMGRPRQTPICPLFGARGHSYRKDGACACGFLKANKVASGKESKPVRVELATLAWLESIAKQRGITLAEAIKTALAEYIAKAEGNAFDDLFGK